MNILLNSDLGPSKVRETIHEDKDIVQSSDKGEQGIKDHLEHVKCPYTEYQESRIKNHSPKQGERQTQSPSQNQNPSHENGLDGNRLMFMLLSCFDPTITLKTDKLKEINIFKNYVSECLDNQHQYFKKFGFSRKRGLTVEDMKKELCRPKTDMCLGSDVLKYLSLVCKVNICIIQKSDFSKEIFMNGKDPETFIIMVSNNDRIIDVMEDKLAPVLKSIFKESNAYHSYQTLPYANLRNIGKFFQVTDEERQKHLKKDELVRYIESKI